MATIVKRGKTYYVVYLYTNEKKKKKQKWESYKTMEEAKKRRLEIEYKKDIGSFIIPQCRTLEELLQEYVNLYGKNTWALSTYESNIRLMDNYIIPSLGGVKLQDLTPRVMEKYYQTLLKTEAVPRKRFGWKEERNSEMVSVHTVRDIHKLLRNCFGQAVKWELMEKNPCINATIPKVQHAKREIWDAETLFRAIGLCKDNRLKLALNLAFCCTLRIGELLGLTWDCIDISAASIEAGEAHIQVNKELQRVNKKALADLEEKDVIFRFPAAKKRQTTALVLKTPKTISSVRRVFLPTSVARMLAEWKKKQDETKEALGSEYNDFNLVFAGPFGMPVENTTINNAFHKLIMENDLPKVVFHSIRHTSITYKLKLNGGDIKSVQGDSGHSQAKMVTDQYSHILDEDRKSNARIFEQYFYSGHKGDEPEEKAAKPDGDLGPEDLLRILRNPEMAALLKTLAKAMDI